MSAPNPPNTPLEKPIPSNFLRSDQITLDTDMAQLARYEKVLTIKEALRKQEEHEERLAEAARARVAGVEATRMQMEQADLKQNQCAHVKENGRSHLAGQRDHSGIVHLICQNCQKAFVGNNVPFHLRPMMDMVGGPNT